MQELAATAEELEKMRMKNNAMVVSAEKEEDTVRKLRAEIAQLQLDEVEPSFR